MKRLMILTGVAVFAACGGDSSSDSAPATTASQPAAAPAAAPATASLNLEGVTLPEGVTAEMVQAGADLYKVQVCTACHGPMGTGMPNLGPDFTDDTWLNNDGSFEGIVTTIIEGVAQPVEAASPMMPRGGAQISDEQVRQLAAYIAVWNQIG